VDKGWQQLVARRGQRAEMDADYRRNSKRLRAEIEAEGGMQWDGRPWDMVRARARSVHRPRTKCMPASSNVLTPRSRPHAGGLGSRGKEGILDPPVAGQVEPDCEGSDMAA
jgi:hypothetical protein